jgi:hypothetical protein
VNQLVRFGGLGSSTGHLLYRISYGKVPGSDFDGLGVLNVPDDAPDRSEVPFRRILGTMFVFLRKLGPVTEKSPIHSVSGFAADFDFLNNWSTGGEWSQCGTQSSHRTQLLAAFEQSGLVGEISSFLQENVGHQPVVIGQINGLAFIFFPGALNSLTHNGCACAAWVEQHMIGLSGMRFALTPAI